MNPASESYRRMRRYRSSPAVRDLLQETSLSRNDLIQPLFFRDGEGGPEPIGSMPGQFRYGVSDLLRQCERCAKAGLKAVALFPCIDPALKDPVGSCALASDNILFRALRAVKAALPDLVLIADVALDPYTIHGHDGVLTPDGRDVANEETVERLARLAVMEAEAGADWVAPSDMMDGRVKAIRNALDGAGHVHAVILAYAAKFASAYYGPFREAVGSATPGAVPLDKRTYQLNPANARESIFDALVDEAEGADMLMVKPAGPYLDILQRLRVRTDLPLAAYQVSGEYAQLQAAAQLGWLDLEKARDESLLGIKRAGADLILTYFALDVAESLR